MTELSPGLYDDLLDQLLRGRVDRLQGSRMRAVIESVDPAELPDRLGEAVKRLAEEALLSTPHEKRGDAALALSGAVVEAIAKVLPNALQPGRQLVDPVQKLAAVAELSPNDELLSVAAPSTPLRDTVLMTNARDQPAVGHEIAAEIDSAERIDLVLAFIRWTGIRELLPALKRHTGGGKSLRVITTTYTGTTELRALQALSALGARVKVSYDNSTTRLHAKAWLFKRPTGVSTVYVGSSNLTWSAQVTGLEWNIRASERRNPELIDAFERTFATYWEDSQFEPFDAEQFAQATRSTSRTAIDTPFDIKPYPYQRRILESLQVERRMNGPHCLVVAATGTGKTVIAALDYRHLRTVLRRSRLLFVAHRREILEQSRAVFRHVLRQGSFGELWVDGHTPEDWDHVFASIQSLAAAGVESLEPDRYDVLIVDEFHHSAAASYEKLLNHMTPIHLVGLTATPERADGLDILRWFGGRIAVELRLWDALEQGVLSPFHYFGIHDGTDLSDVTWRRGSGYDVRELTNLYTAEHFRVSKVIEAVRDKVGRPECMRALGFCVSIEHADFMAAQFQRAGLEARSVTSDTSGAERRQALSDLRDGKVQVLFTVDLFNEGVDVPSIDVVLMLRPTESATIFLQQLGRGLRRTDNKDVLTVLDFVGHQRAEFRFDERYRRLLGRTRRELVQDLENDFPYLPAGCLLTLDRVTRKLVLDNVRHALPTTWKRRVQELRELGDVSLRTYLEETGLELQDVYRNGRSWTELRRVAGLAEASTSNEEAKIGRGISRLLHIDDAERIATVGNLLANPKEPDTNALDQRTRRQFEGLMLTLLNPRKGMYRSLQEAVAVLWSHNALRLELTELLPLLENQVLHLHKPLSRSSPVPLQTHASYTREEILAAFGVSHVHAPLPLQTGIYWHQETRTHLLFVTLQKTAVDYSPTTRYLDYAISESLFHWETQGTTTAASDRGRSYIEHQARGDHVALFVRAMKRDKDRTLPYFCVGHASYVTHESDRPVRITWRLHDPLPGDVFAAYRAAVA